MTRFDDWRSFDAARRQREVSPSSCVGGDFMPFVAGYDEGSEAARTTLKGHYNIPYGTLATQRFDLFSPEAATAKPPLLVFIHGGYWQALSKDASLFAAPDCVAQGCAFAALDYTLASYATVAEIVTECRAAIAYLHANAAALGFDPNRIIVAGSSAGGHLAAMCALASTHIKAVVIVSGVLELEPLIGTDVNDALALDVATAQALSPLLHELDHFPSSVVCWGENETGEFKRQSQAFADRLRSAGRSVSEFEVPVRNHFDIVLDLVKPGTRLGDACLGLINQSH